MALNERSYSGRLFRPRPEIHFETEGRLVVIATPWGPRSSAKKAIQIIQDYFLSSQQDEEATSPFARLNCLSPLANDLRIAVKLANDSIFNDENKSEFISGIEIFAMARKQSEVAWAQVGHPFVLLDRSYRSLSALSAQTDLSVEYSRGLQSLPPLPSKLLGVDSSSDFAVESFHPSPNDRLLLISRSSLPPELYKIPAHDRDIDRFSKLMSNDDPDSPFWICHLPL